MKTIKFLPLLMAAAVSGCVTMDSSTNTEISRQNLELNNLKASVEGLDRAVRDSDAVLQKILQDLETIKSTSRADAQRISGLENQARNAAQANEQMRKEIVADLSKRMAEVMKAYYQTPVTSGRTSVRTSDTGSGTGSSTSTGSSSESGTKEHIVEAGQSITKIASIYGVSVNSIMNANNISNPNLIRAGQKLIIPK